MNTNGFFRRELPGGVRLVGERVAGRRSVAVGIWLRVGSRDEDPGREGLAHFIEHMVFKGTATRTGAEIARSLEQGGGSLEAYTTKDTTCFYARVLEDQVEPAIEVLGDMVSRPRFEAEDVDVERKVVLEELCTVEDTPEDLVGDLAQFHLWPGDIMGSSILGTRDSIDAIDADRVREFHGSRYRTPRIVVGAAGAIEEESLADLVTRHLDLPDGPAEDGRRAPVAAHSTLALYPWDLSQTHLVLMTSAPSDRDPRRRPLHLLAEIFGGGMSSRLFQTIREESGLAYAVQAYTEHFDDVGMFGVSLAVSPERAGEAVTRTLEEMDRMRREGLRPGELEGAKAQIRGSLIMGLESLTNRMSHLVRNEFRFGKPRTLESILEAYEGIREEDLREVAEEVLNPARLSLVALGPSDPGALGFKTFDRTVTVPGT